MILNSFKFKKFNINLAVLTLYSIITSIFFYPIFWGKASIFTDNLLHIGPAYSFWKSEITQGRIPLWNNLNLNGLPFLADPAHPVFSPFNIFFLLFEDIFVAINIQVWLMIVFNAFGAYYLLKKMKFANWISLFGGLGYGFSGSVFEASATDLNTLIGITLMPWILAAFIKDNNKEKIGINWLLSILLAVQLLSSHTQYSYYVLLIVSIFIFINILKNRKNWKSIRNHIVRYFLTFLVGFLIAAVQLIPSLELIQQTNRQKNIDYKDIVGVPVQAIPRYIFPKIFGSVNEGSSWGPKSQQETGLANVNGFVSISIVIFVLSLLFYKNGKNKFDIKILALVILITLIISLGNQTKIFWLFYNYFPGFNFFRSPSRILLIYSLIMSILASYGMSFLEKIKIKINYKFIYLIIGLIIISLVFVWIYDKTFFNTVFAKAYQLFRNNSISNAAGYNVDKINEISNLILQSLIYFFIGVFGFVLILNFSQTKSLKIFILAILTITIELFFTIRGDLMFVPIEDIYINKNTINFIKNNLGSNFRMVSTGDVQPYTGFWVYFNHLISRPPFSNGSVGKNENKNWNRLLEELEMIPASTHQLYKIPSAASYVAIMPERYRLYWGSNNVNSINYGNYENIRFNETNVKYFITGYPMDVIENHKSGRFQKIYEKGKIRIYENKEAKPRANLIDNKNKQLAVGEIRDINPQIVEINIDSTQSGRLVLRDFYYPGWIALVDGVKQEIKPYDILFRSVEISAGKHVISFEYKPVSFKIGVIVSLFSIIGLVIYTNFKKIFNIKTY